MALTILKWIGRVVFFALLAIQCGFLTAYPGQYKDDSVWCVVAVSYAPAFILWLCLMCWDVARLLPFFWVWATYIVGALLPNVIVIFGFVVESIDKRNFLSPNVLKLALCITPVLLLLLLNTADHGDEDKDEKNLRREVVFKLSAQMAIDLLDTIEILDIVLESVLDEKEHNNGIPRGFGIAMICVACIGFLLSLAQLVEIKFDDSCRPVKSRYKTSLVRTAAEMIAVNLVFLISRLIVFFKYGKDESIFIAKNFIALLLASLQIRYQVDSH